jgi:outer membrane protein TolC
MKHPIDCAGRAAPATASRPATFRSAAALGITLACILAFVLALPGCATFSPDGGFGVVAGQARAHLDKEVSWPRTEDESAKNGAEAARLLAQPLTADAAVQVALLDNRSLQAAFEELGISEAELVQSGRLPNPRFSLRHASAAGAYDIEEGVTVNVLALAAMPAAHDLEKRRFAETQQRVLLAVARLAAQTRGAFIRAVAAAESVHYLEQVELAAGSGAELARRMQAAGNWTVLDRAREQGFEAEAARDLEHAKLEAAAAREALARLLGTPSDESSLHLTDRLPDLPPSAAPAPDEAAALLQERIDLRIGRRRIDALAHELRLVKATRFIDVLDAGPTRVRQGGESSPYERGYEIDFEVPLFDGGGARVRRAEAIYRAAVDRYAQAVVEARSQIRGAAAAYRARFEIARMQRDEVIPRVKAVAGEDLKRYDGALVSVFDLLSDSRSEMSSVDTYIRDVRDFWVAKADLDASMLGGNTHDDP